MMATQYIDRRMSATERAQAISAAKEAIEAAADLAAQRAAEEQLRTAKRGRIQERVDLSAEEEAEVDARAAASQLESTRSAVISAIRRTALGYLKGRLSALESYDEMRLLVLAASMHVGQGVLTPQARAARDTFEYAEERISWALFPDRTAEELGEYDPALDRQFPS